MTAICIIALSKRRHPRRSAAQRGDLVVHVRHRVPDRLPPSGIRAISPRPAHGQATDAQGGLADADRDGLTGFAAGPDAMIQRRVIANH